MSKTPSVRGALAWSFAERYLSLLVSITSTVVLARLLTPQQVGVYSLCAVVTTLATIFRDFGTSEYLIQERELTREKLRSAFTITLLMAWSIAAVVFVGRGYLADFYAEPGLSEVLAVLSLNFLILPLASPTFALLNREMAFDKTFRLQIASNIASAATSITLAYRGHGYMSLAWGPVVGISTQALILVCMRPGDALMMPSLRSAYQALRFGSMFTATRLLESAAHNGHELIIGKQFGFASLGLFSRAAGLIDLLFTAVTSAIARVATPALAADHRAGRSLVEPFAKGTMLFTSIAWPFMSFVALMSGDIINLMFGTQWLAAGPIASLLALSAVPSCLTALVPNALASTGQVQRRLSVALWYSPVHLVCVLVASFFGLHAVALAFGLSRLLQACLNAHHLRVVLNTRVGLLFLPSLASAKLTLCCTVAQFLALSLSQQLAWPLIPRLTLVALATAAIWLAAATLLRHPVIHELQQLFRHVRGRSRNA